MYVSSLLPEKISNWVKIMTHEKNRLIINFSGGQQECSMSPVMGGVQGFVMGGPWGAKPCGDLGINPQRLLGYRLSEAPKGCFTGQISMIMWPVTLYVSGSEAKKVLSLTHKPVLNFGCSAKKFCSLGPQKNNQYDSIFLSYLTRRFYDMLE